MKWMDELRFKVDSGSRVIDWLTIGLIAVAMFIAGCFCWVKDRFK